MGTTRTCFVFAECKCFDSGVNTTPENEGVKALSEACLDRSYLWCRLNIHFGKIHAALLRPMLPELSLVILSRQKLCSASLPAKT